jgi:hypothetical protein
MTTLFKFFQSLVRCPKSHTLPDSLLQDIGLSRVIVEYA